MNPKEWILSTQSSIDSQFLVVSDRIGHLHLVNIPIQIRKLRPSNLYCVYAKRSFDMLLCSKEYMGKIIC